MLMLRDEIKQIVQASVLETLGHLGFTVNDPHAIQKDMIHLRAQRLHREEFGKWMWRSVLGVSVPALLYMMWGAFSLAVQTHS